MRGAICLHISCCDNLSCSHIVTKSMCKKIKSKGSSTLEYSKRHIHFLLPNNWPRLLKMCPSISPIVFSFFNSINLHFTGTICSTQIQPNPPIWHLSEVLKSVEFFLFIKFSATLKENLDGTTFLPQHRENLIEVKGSYYYL